MFDFAITNENGHASAPPVLFLSDAFGVEREWEGITLCLGPRGACQTFTKTADWARAIDVAPDGAHLVVHGPRAYDALRIAAARPDQVRSLTLIDPDLISAFPELAPCMQYRGQARMIFRAQAFAAQGSHREAARVVIDWWMGKGTWARTSMRLRSRFARGVSALLADWKAQAREPLDLIDLSQVDVPIRVVTGVRAPADIRAMARLLRTVCPQMSVSLVKKSGAVPHLTDAHVVGPDVGKFVVSSDLDWQSRPYLAQAA